jgi:cell division protein FtsL
MKKLTKIFKLNSLIILLTFMVLVMKVYYSDKVATAGQEYSSEEDKLHSLQKENENIHNDIFEIKSLSKIHEKAIVLGFEKAVIEYYEDPELALR